MNIGWISDTHIGRQQYGRKDRRHDFDHAFLAAIDLFDKAGVTNILHSGDIINSTRPSPDDICTLKTAHAKLRYNQQSMYVISGNHDLSRPHWITVVNDNITGPFGLKLLDREMTTLTGGLTLFGMSYTGVDDFKKFDFPKADILLMHQAVTEFVGFAGNTLALADLPQDKYDAILMGDIHVDKQQMVAREDRCPLFVGYPGSTELCEESEEGIKHAHVLGIEPGKGVVTHDKLVIPTRGVIRVNLRDEKDVEGAMESVRVYKKMLEKTGDHRPPIIFIKHWNTLHNVIDRFQSTFSAADYIFRFKPVFVSPTTKQTVSDADIDAEVEINQLIRLTLQSSPGLVVIGEQLVNPTLDPNAVLDQFIEERLNAIEAHAGTPAIA